MQKQYTYEEKQIVIECVKETTEYLGLERKYSK